MVNGESACSEKNGRSADWDPDENQGVDPRVFANLTKTVRCEDCEEPAAETLILTGLEARE